MTRIQTDRQPDEHDKRIGRRVRDIRNQRRVTLIELATALHLTYQQIHKYEVGLNRIPAGKLYQISLTLQVPVAKFFED